MRLTLEQKLEIRALYAAGGITQWQLAERYDVGQNTISLVIRQPLRQCVECGDLSGQAKRCKDCKKACHMAHVKRWNEAHREQLRAAHAVRWRTDARYRARHRITAREYQRRKAAKKREGKSA